MPLYKIAGLYVEMYPEFDRTKLQAEKYLTDDDRKPDISIPRYDDLIEFLSKKDPEIGVRYEKNDISEYILFGSFFNQKLIRKDGFFLHASCVVYDNRAYCFSANCGTGKSTHTAQWLKLFGDEAYILNDDKPAIRLIDGVFYACGTPFSGKYDISRNEMIPLGGICFISRAAENSIEKISDTQAIGSIMPQTMYRYLKYDTMDILLSFLDKLVRAYPIYRLHCNISTDAARLSYETMSNRKINTEEHK